MNYASGIFALCLLLNGCAQQPKGEIEPSLSNERVRKILSSQEKDLADLREKVFVLETLLAQQTVAQKSAHSSQPSPVRVETPTVVHSELSGPQEYTGPKGEHFLYAKVIEQYRKKQLDGVERATELFLKSFPKSVHADNALLMLGQKYYQNRMFEKARLTFKKLRRLYPLGNKFAAATLALGLTFKKIGEKRQAMSLLSSVVSRFPGSREAYLGKTELTFLQTGEK